MFDGELNATRLMKYLIGEKGNERLKKEEWSMKVERKSFL